MRYVFNTTRVNDRVTHTHLISLVVLVYVNITTHTHTHTHAGGSSLSNSLSPLSSFSAPLYLSDPIAAPFPLLSDEPRLETVKDCSVVMLSTMEHVTLTPDADTLSASAMPSQ